MSRRFLTALAVWLLCLCCVQTAYASESAVLTFGDDGITETQAGSGYSIDDSTLTITSAGVYRVTGLCDEGAIVVKGSVDGAVLVLDNLTLSSSTTAPIVVKKASNVTIHLEGVSTLTDAEDASTEETNSDFEGAAIKVKSGSTVTFCGGGTLAVNGNAKNGIKGGSEASLTFVSGTYQVSAQNNGIASDGSLLFESGSYVIDSQNDGIKSVPEADDTASAGTITINGGSYAITAAGDGIQADAKLAIFGGSFDITTFGGYNAAGFDKDTMSCKGLKASGDRELENMLVVSGGTFKLNTADDAVHSDANVEITGGTFDIYTGDDGVHGDTSLVLGSEGGYERDPQITINASYEGLEAGTVYVYSGKYWVVASDDGINAAGGSSNGTDPGQGGGNSFRPGGRPGMPGFQPGGGGTGGSSDYNLYVYGGDIYINCTGDGLDSNGGLYLYGGNQTVLSQGTGGDNSPLDCDGTMVVKGATVFAAGTNPMNENPGSGSQSWYRWTNRYNAGTVVTLKSGDATLYSEKLLRATNYVLYSSPSVNSQPSVVTNASLDACKSNAWQHSWGEAEMVSEPTADTAGVAKYTCKDCGKTEQQSVLAEASASCDGHEAGSGSDTGSDEPSGDVTDEGYAVSFVVGEGASVNVYYTQDYATVSEQGATSAVSRNSDTGEPDSTGSGQVNFSVVLQDGYELSGDPVVEGGYKNLKNISDAGVANTYRVTKVTSALTITIATTKTSGSDEGDGVTETQSMYRLYNPNSGEHFYTADEVERDKVVAAGWTYEGVGWIAPTESDTPVYRLYNANGGEHHYTISSEERDYLIAAGWNDEGIGWYSDDAKGVELLREYNPNQLSCNHNYTTSREEHDSLVSLGWVDEGVAWYGVAS